MNFKDIIGVICGFLIIVFGVFLLYVFKDVYFSLKDVFKFFFQVNGVSKTRNFGKQVNDEIEVMFMYRINNVIDDDEEEFVIVFVNNINYL